MDWDDAYANAPYIPGAGAYPRRWAADAAAFREHLAEQGRLTSGIAYGSRARERFDLCHAKDPAQGLCVFVHGGYWLKFHRDFWSHFAAGPLARGWHVAIPSYDLCPDVGIADITRQIAQAIMQAATKVSGPIVLAGHSAGGHLVARMCVDGVLPDATAARIRHVMPISPVSDLRPLINTAMNADFRLDAQSAIAESPALMSPRPIPVTVWVGADERPVFLDQARWLSEAWGAAHVVDADRHHFDVIDGLKEPDSPITMALLA